MRDGASLLVKRYLITNFDELRILAFGFHHLPQSTEHCGVAPRSNSEMSASSLLSLFFFLRQIARTVRPSLPLTAGPRSSVHDSNVVNLVCPLNFVAARPFPPVSVDGSITKERTTPLGSLTSSPPWKACVVRERLQLSDDILTFHGSRWTRSLHCPPPPPPFGPDGPNQRRSARIRISVGKPSHRIQELHKCRRVSYNFS